MTRCTWPCPEQHRLADVPELSLADFADEPWMLATTASCPDARLFLRSCHAAGFEPRIAFQNDDYSAILGFVAAGVGMALIPDMVSRGAREDVTIRTLSRRRRRVRSARCCPPDTARRRRRRCSACSRRSGRSGWPTGASGWQSGQRVTQAPSSWVSFSTAAGSLPVAMSAIVTCSATRRRLTRTAIQTRGRLSAAPP